MSDCFGTQSLGASQRCPSILIIKEGPIIDPQKNAMQALFERPKDRREKNEFQHTKNVRLPAHTHPPFSSSSSLHLRMSMKQPSYFTATQREQGGT
jgi:hypothetical protein